MRIILISNFLNMLLAQLKIHEKAKIIGFAPGNKAYRQKLLAMGLTPGTEFVVIRLAPLGDPIEIQVRGFSLSLRKDEATYLQVERL